MLPQVDGVDHNSASPPDRAGIAAHPAHPARPADWKAIEDVLGLLARAIQQLQTYPSTSPLCVAAIDTSHRALAALDTREHLAFRVTPAELLVDGVATGRGTPVGRELAARLHRTSIASVLIDRDASPREIGRFCEDLVLCSSAGAPAETLLDVLTEHGIDRITVARACRPEVLEVGCVPAPTEAAVTRERARFEAQMAKGGVVHHLYPPQKGWVRLDPASALPAVSLLDLAVLVDDPGALASMLLRLTGDAAEKSPQEALEQKYSDVAMLIAALDPRLARRLFAKLARAVLDLEPGSRQALLRRTVLPGLLDGRVDGAVLREFPDVDLAESLCLLLDLETAAPELLATALSRLDLPAERHAAMVPLLDARLREREASAAANPDTDRQTALARHARTLVGVDVTPGKSFADYAAFDLSMDTGAIAALRQIRSAVPATDAIVEQLVCLWHLLCLEPNPECVGRYLDRSMSLLGGLGNLSRGGELPPWLAAYRGLAERLRDARPDVADEIARHLRAFCTPARAGWMVDLAQGGPHDQEAAAAVIDALGDAVAAPLVTLLEQSAAARAGSPGAAERGRAAAKLLTGHATVLAPAVASLLATSTPAVARTLLRVLGSGGPGHEETVGAYVRARDEQTGREALRALARVGTPRAAAFVVAEISRQQGALSVAAEETLWHFPAGEALRHTRELLGRREFTMRYPEAAGRLLDRAARSGTTGLATALQGIAPLRFRIWNPAVARVARKAHRMLQPAAPAAPRQADPGER